MGRSRIDQLSDGERARFNEWADRWIEVGLRTGPADRERFLAGVRECYRFAGIPFPEVVVWVPSPIVLAFAAPAAALAIELIDGARRSGLPLRRGAVDGAVDDAVGGAVGGAVRGAVGDAVRDAVRDAVGGAVGGAVGDAVRGAVGGAVDQNSIRRAVFEVIHRSWARYFGGQFWAGGWGWWGGAYTSFFREVAGLELPGDLWERGKAYEATIESACWWWPHRRFVMVCERPTEIHRELARPDVERGWGSHRLHRDDGPAVVWPDGWGIYAVHGTRVSRQIIMAPETLTADQITAEQNAEVRRVMLDRFGIENYIRSAGAKAIDRSDYGTLYRAELPGDEPILMVQLENGTAEPDGSFKEYWLRVPPTIETAREAVAWTFDMKPKDYDLAVQT